MAQPLPNQVGGAGPFQAIQMDGPSMYTSAGGQIQQVENANYAHLPSLEHAVLECIQAAPPQDEGVNMEVFTKQVLAKQGVNANQIKCVQLPHLVVLIC